MKPRWHIAAAICCNFTFSLHVPLLLATELEREEHIPIRAIIANPQAFNMRAVRLQGIIKTLAIIPSGGGCTMHKLYDAYVFILTDHTGEITIFDRGTCAGTPASGFRSVQPHMSEFAIGDGVEVIIDVSLLYSPNFESHSLEGALRWVKRIPDLAGSGSGANP